MDKKELGARIKEFRLANNLTQQDIADYLQLKNKSNVGSWEIGKSEQEIDTFAKVCLLFNICPNEFINFKENAIVTLKEKKHLKKYRELDSKSKEIVDYIIDAELSRFSDEKYITEVAARGDSEKKVKISKEAIRKDLENYTPPEEL